MKGIQIKIQPNSAVEKGPFDQPQSLPRPDLLDGALSEVAHSLRPVPYKWPISQTNEPARQQNSATNSTQQANQLLKKRSDLPTRQTSQQTNKQNKKQASRQASKQANKPTNRPSKKNSQQQKMQQTKQASKQNQPTDQPTNQLTKPPRTSGTCCTANQTKHVTAKVAITFPSESRLLTLAAGILLLHRLRLTGSSEKGFDFVSTNTLWDQSVPWIQKLKMAKPIQIVEWLWHEAGRPKGQLHHMTV